MGWAGLAKIRPRRTRNRVQVAARCAPLELTEDRPILAERQNRFVDEVSRPFVVDYGPRTEFGDGKEPRSRKELVSLLGPPAWNIRRQWQAWEVVPGQEALAGKVPIAVEIGLDDVLRLGQQFVLRFGFPSESLGLAAFVRRARHIHNDGVLNLLLGQCRFAEIAPALASRLEIEFNLLKDLFGPLRRVPVGVLEIVFEGGQNALRSNLRCQAWLGTAQRIEHRSDCGQSRVIPRDIE